MTITDFLLARIAEDEAAARAADGSRWLHEDKVVTFTFWDEEHGEYDWRTMLSANTRANGDYIATWSPARVLAECEAKRRIVEAVTWGRPVRTPDGTFKGRFNVTQVREPRDDFDSETVLAALALPYAGHPDYDEAWRP